jgi:TrmH family RNA methyltransferase
MFVIQSAKNEKIKALKLLANQRGPLADQFFIVEGFHAVTMASQAGQLKEVILIHPDDFKPKKTEVVYQVPDHILQSLSSQKTPQGILGVCEKAPLQKPRWDGSIIYLDHIQDPGNVGTMLRTSLALGVQTVILSKGTCDLYNPKVLASSQGAIFKLTMIVDDHDLLLDQLKEFGYTIYATTLAAKAIPLNEVEFTQKNVLIFGNESHGVQASIVAKSDCNIMIPMVDIDSLNVAIAHAIITYTMKNKIK